MIGFFVVVWFGTCQTLLSFLYPPNSVLKKAKSFSIPFAFFVVAYPIKVAEFYIKFHVGLFNPISNQFELFNDFKWNHRSNRMESGSTKTSIIGYSD